MIAQKQEKNAKKQYYYKNRKAILKRKALQYEEENAWREMFGEDPFELGQIKKGI